MKFGCGKTNPVIPSLIIFLSTKHDCTLLSSIQQIHKNLYKLIKSYLVDMKKSEWYSLKYILNLLNSQEK